MANNKDFVVKNPVEVGASVSTKKGSVVDGDGYNIHAIAHTGKMVNFSDINPSGGFIFFANNGTKLYSLQSSSNVIHQMSLDIAWDIHSVSDDSSSFTVTDGTTTQITHIAIGSSGTKLYALSVQDEVIYQYTMSTAYDVSSATYDSKSFDPTTEATSPREFVIDATGTRLYVVGGTDMYQYTLATPWDITTADYDSKTLTTDSVDSFDFSSDGTMLFIHDTGEDINRYDLSTAWDISTATQNTSETRDFTDVLKGYIYYRFSDDGKNLYVASSSDDVIQARAYAKELDLSTGQYFSYQLEGLIEETIDFRNPPSSSSVNTFFLELIGPESYVSTNVITQGYTSGDVLVNSQTTSPYGMFIPHSGDKFYLLGQSADTVYQYTLEQLHNVRSLSYDSKSFSVGTQESDPRAITLNQEGTKLFVVGGTDSVHGYDLSTAWDISTATYNSAYDYDYSGKTTTSDPAIRFSKDGSVMYIQGGNAVFQYDLSTAYDPSTATFDYEFAIGFGCVGFDFREDGKMVVFNDPGTGSEIRVATLTTAWDLETAQTQNLQDGWEFQTTNNTAQDIVISNKGRYLAVAQNATDDIQFIVNGYVPRVRFPSSVSFPNGDILSSMEPGDKRLYSFTTYDGGSTYEAYLIAKDYS